MRKGLVAARGGCQKLSELKLKKCSRKLANACLRQTRQGDVVYHVARRLNRHVGAVRERLLAVTVGGASSSFREKQSRTTGRRACPPTRRGLRANQFSTERDQWRLVRYPDSNYDSSHEERCLRFDMAWPRSGGKQRKLCRRRPGRWRRGSPRLGPRPSPTLSPRLRPRAKRRLRPRPKPRPKPKR